MVLANEVIKRRYGDIKKKQAKIQAEKQQNKVLKKKLTTIPPTKFIKTSGIAKKNERQIFDDLMKIKPEQTILYPSQHIFIVRVNQTFKTTQFIENLLNQLNLKNPADAIFVKNEQNAYQLCNYLKKYIAFGYFTQQQQIETIITRYGLIDDKLITNNNIVEEKYKGEILSIGEIAQMLFDGECKDVNQGIKFKITNDQIMNNINQKKDNLILGDLSEKICEFI